jgi:hypothetical protein
MPVLFVVGCVIPPDYREAFIGGDGSRINQNMPFAHDQPATNLVPFETELEIPNDNVDCPAP